MCVCVCVCVCVCARVRVCVYVIYMDYPVITENIMDEPESVIVNINATRGQLKKYGWKAYLLYLNFNNILP